MKRRSSGGGGSPSGFFFTALTVFASACAVTTGSAAAFPAAQRTGVEVLNPNARLDAAVEEYLDVLGVPVRGGGLRGSVVETEWFPVANLEEAAAPLAVCPRPAAEAEPAYRARYRFTILPRAGARVFQAEAHWQRAVAADEQGVPMWADCRSTGTWERSTEERLILRAELMG